MNKIAGLGRIEERHWVTARKIAEVIPENHYIHIPIQPMADLFFFTVRDRMGRIADHVYPKVSGLVIMKDEGIFSAVQKPAKKATKKATTKSQPTDSE